MKRLAIVAVLAGLAVVAVGNAVVLLGGRGAPPRHAQTALVLGALVHSDGRLSTILEDRVATAAKLYRDGRVDTVLVSGDHGRLGYDAVTPMRKRVIALGVPAGKVFEDHAGFDTWASVKRARTIFGARDVIVVSNRFHLARAVWLARKAGLTAGGIAADRAGGYGIKGREAGVREVLARVKAVAIRPTPLSGPQIPLTSDGRLSWGPSSRAGAATRPARPRRARSS